MSVANPEILALTLEAKSGTDNEKSMTLRQSFPLYKKAMAWSILFSTAIVMEGYDTALLGSFYAFPKLTEKYRESIGNDATPLTSSRPLGRQVSLTAPCVERSWACMLLELSWTSSNTVIP